MEEKSQNRGGNSEKKRSYRPCSSIFEGVRSFILYALHSPQSPSNLPHSFYPFGDNYVILQHRNVKPFIHMTQTSRIHTYTYGQIWQIAYPILLSVLMEQLIGMTDTAFLGRVGEVELGASAIGGIFYVAVFMLGMGFSVGTQILMARRNGEGRYADIGVIFYHSLAFLLAMAAVLFALTRLYAPALLTRLMNSADVCHAASDFLHWRVYSFFFSFINVLFRAFYVATTNTRTLTFNSLVLVVSNFLFTYTLIFGHFGFPAYGIAGAAMGNTLAAATSTVFFIIHTLRHVDCAKFGLNRLPRFRFSLLNQVLGVSIWTMVQDFLSLATWFLFFIGVEHLGERELASTNLVRNISAFTFMTVIAIASTASTLAGNLMGQGEYDAIRPMMKKCIKLGYAILIPVIFLLCIFPDVVLGIFTNDQSLIDVSVVPLYVLLSAYIFTIPGQILLKTVSGTGNTRTALACEVATLGVYTLYVVVVILMWQVSLPICWLSEHVYSFFITLMTGFYMAYGHWERKKI